MAINNSNNTPELTSTGQLFIGVTGSNPIANDLSAGTGISIDNSPGATTISISESTENWIVQTTTPAAMDANTGYTANGSGTTIAFSLPTSAAIGDFVEINGHGTPGVGFFEITQDLGQSINFGNITTTLGSGGSITARNSFNNIKLRCITANTTWNVVQATGNFTIV